jgi:RND family efflux transporter MFP subunit
MRLLKIIVLVNFIALAVVSCSKKEEKKATPVNTVPTLQAVEVVSLQPVKPLVLPGELHPWNKVNLVSKVKGFVKEIKVDRGSVVKKGQLLAILDAPEIVTELDQSFGQVHAAEGSLNEAKANYSSNKSTYLRLLKASETPGAVSDNELEQAKSKMHADSSAVANAIGNLKAARSNYNTKSELANYLKIIAPFNGVIIERNISPGALIGAGDANSKPLFVLEDNSTLRLTVAIPESYSNFVHKNDSISFTVNSVHDKNFKAVYGRSSESVLQKNRVMMTEFDVDNTKGELKAGMYAEVQLPIKRSSPTLFVPKSAIVSSSEKVFIIRSLDDKAEWVDVKKGITIDTLTEIFGEVQQGELIVKEASEELREGQLLKLKK